MSRCDPSEVRRVLDSVFTEEAGRIVSSVVRVTGDWELAEDCLQDAFIRALTAWAERGVPANPGGWLTTAARNRAIDQIRRAAVERRAVGQVAYEKSLDAAEESVRLLEEDQVDDRLSLIFTCCHPALPMEARVALTLRTVGGLSIASIARMFLVSEQTMVKRLVRARAKIKNAGISFQVPSPELWAERMTGVLSVLYLLFTEGYTATEHESLINVQLEAEAIRLTRLLVVLIDDVDAAVEPVALLALMLLQSSRDDARVAGNGTLIPLEDQDRTLWNGAAITEGADLVNRLTRRLQLTGHAPGPYYLQAAIAGCHAVAGSPETTDFVRIASLYAALLDVAPSAVVELNYAVALGLADGLQVGLARIQQLAASGALDDYYLLPAAEADLLRRLGRNTEAVERYRKAASLAPSAVEREFLCDRIRALENLR